MVLKQCWVKYFIKVFKIQVLDEKSISRQIPILKSI